MTQTLTETSSGDTGTRGSYGASGTIDTNGRSAASTGEDELESLKRTARGLGWFSVGLGVAQLLMPRGLARAIGVGHEWGSGSTVKNVMLTCGVRELAAGAGLLSRSRQAPWLWARVAGDALDIALLLNAYRSRHASPGRLTAALASVVGVTYLDVVTGRKLGEYEVSEAMDGVGATGRTRNKGRQVVRSITIDRPASEVYSFWRNFQNLPRFMAHLEEVTVQDGKRSHWKAKGPAGVSVEWDAEMTADVPNERIAWHSVQGADVPNRGEVHFLPAPGGRGTVVQVSLSYEPPAGALGATVAKLMGKEPGQQVSGDLRRFKQVMEIGEVVHSDASIAKGKHPARPGSAKEKAR